MTDPSSMAGKVAIVTGTSHGMGLSVTQILLARGAKVLGIDISPIADSLQNKPNYTHHQADLTQPTAPSNAVQACAKAYGPRIDALLNVAGIMDRFASVDTLTDDVWAKVLAVDLTAPVMLMRAVVNVMKAQEPLDGERGVILNVSSRAGMIGSAAGVAYTAAKHGLIGATKQTAFRFRSDAIRCNAVAPGAVATNMALEFDKLDMVTLQAASPVRSLAQPDAQILQAEDVARVMAYLVSPASKGVTGTVVPVDNGWSVC